MGRRSHSVHTVKHCRAGEKCLHTQPDRTARGVYGILRPSSIRTLTVGPGISPESALARSRAFTAGQELHHALKVVTYVQHRYCTKRLARGSIMKDEDP